MSDEVVPEEDIPGLHQFARMILAATASFVVGKLVERLYDKVYENRHSENMPELGA